MAEEIWQFLEANVNYIVLFLTVIFVTSLIVVKKYKSFFSKFEKNFSGHHTLQIDMLQTNNVEIEKMKNHFSQKIDGIELIMKNMENILKEIKLMLIDHSINTVREEVKNIQKTDEGVKNA